MKILEASELGGGDIMVRAWWDFPFVWTNHVRSCQIGRLC